MKSDAFASRARWLCAAGLLLIATTSAFAQTAATTPPGNLGQTCGPDLRKHCATTMPGGGRMLACLQSNEAQLTPVCKAQLPAMAECRDEAVKLCGDVSPRAMRSCFAAKREQFSAACREMQP
jgi:Cysteine rich repeat